MANLIGQSLGRYHILEQLGEGGMATVYKAFDTRLEREVAVKVIRTENILPSALDRTLKRFEREARSLAKLNHPNIVSVIEYGEHEGSPFLVMEYISAGTLKQKLGKPIIWHEAIILLLPISKALAYSHHQGIVHRDVKPSNILITDAGEPMLTDFGIAKLLETDDGNTLSTGTGVGVGTPEYMAPEQGMGHEVDARADIYSLGIVFYEILTGRKPFTADTPMAVIVKHINDPLPRAKKYITDLPDSVERILLKALAKKPDDRYGNMSEFGKAMDRSLEPIRAKEKELVRKKEEAARKEIEITKRAEEKKKAQAARLQRQQEKEKSRKEKNSNRAEIIRAISSSFAKKPASLKKIRLSPTQVRYALMIFVSIIAISGIIWFIRQPFFETVLNPPAQVEPSALPVLLPPSTPSETPTLTVTATLASSPTVTITITRPPTQTTTPIPAQAVESTMAPNEIVDEKGISMMLIPVGEFVMGRDDGQTSEKPAHAVYLDAYYIDKFEVSNALYRACVDAGACSAPTSSRSNTRADYYTNPEFNNYPVINVNWEMAGAYCKWREAKLPTEAQWEKAAGGGTQNRYVWGDTKNYPDGCAYGNICLGEGSPTQDTVAIGQFLANPYGIYDMAGNVWEWTADWYSGIYYKDSPFENPFGPNDGQARVLRGGYWTGDGRSFKPSFRFYEAPEASSNKFGFRCAMSAEK